MCTNAVALVIGKCQILDEDETRKKSWDCITGGLETYPEVWSCSSGQEHLGSVLKALDSVSTMPNKNALKIFILNSGEKEVPLRVYWPQNNS